MIYTKNTLCLSSIQTTTLPLNLSCLVVYFPKCSRGGPPRGHISKVSLLHKPRCKHVRISRPRKSPPHPGRLKLSCFRFSQANVTNRLLDDWPGALRVPVKKRGFWKLNSNYGNILDLTPILEEFVHLHGKKSGLDVFDQETAIAQLEALVRFGVQHAQYEGYPQ